MRLEIVRGLDWLMLDALMGIGGFEYIYMVIISDNPHTQSLLIIRLNTIRGC